MWILRYVAATSPSGEACTQTLRSLLSPGSATATEPTRSRPSSAAISRIHITARPSSGSARARSCSGEPSTFHFSGRTTRRAPAPAAARTCSSAAERLASGSGPELSWTAATLIVDSPVNIPGPMLPWRSDTDGPSRPAGLPLPPARLPLVYGGRPLKRWRYVGAFGERAMVCVGFARVLGVPQAWWAVWERESDWLRERTIFARPAHAVRFAAGRVTVRDGDCAIDLEVDEVAGVESVCPHGGAHVWTRKQADIAVRGTVDVAGQRIELDARGVVDDTAGYHARHTEWRWSAGVGTTVDGRSVGWNLVAGVNDPVSGSERSVWVDGAASE